MKPQARNPAVGLIDVLATNFGYDIDPALKHCQAEFDDAARAGDIEKMKAIVIREGLEWAEPQLPEKYRTGDDR